MWTSDADHRYRVQHSPKEAEACWPGGPPGHPHPQPRRAVVLPGLLPLLSPPMLPAELHKQSRVPPLALLA